MMFQCLDWCFWWIMMDHGATFVSAFASSLLWGPMHRRFMDCDTSYGMWNSRPVSFLQFSGCHLTEFGTLKSFKIPQFYARCSPNLHHIYGKLGFSGCHFLWFSMIFSYLFPFPDHFFHWSPGFSTLRALLLHLVVVWGARLLRFSHVEMSKKWVTPQKLDFFLMENPWKIGWWGFRFVMGVPQNWYVFFHGKSMKILTFGWFGGTPSSPSSLDGWFHWGYPLNFGNTHIRKWMVYDGTSIYKMDDLEWYPDLASWISQRAMIRQKRQIFHKTTQFRDSSWHCGKTTSGKTCTIWLWLT